MIAALKQAKAEAEADGSKLAWPPREDSELLAPLKDAVRGSLEDERAARVAAAMGSLQGPGRVALRWDQVKDHKKEHPRAPSNNQKKPNGGPRRWVAAAAEVAALVKARGVELRRAVHADLDEMEAEPEPQEVIDALEAQVAQIPALILERDRARDSQRKALERCKEWGKEKKATKEAARVAAELKAQAKVAEAQAQLAAELGKAKEDLEACFGYDLQQREVERNKARERARDAKAEAKKLQRQLAALQKKVDLELEAASESESSEPEIETDDESDDEQQPPSPLNVLPRRDERGRWQAEDEDIRGMRYAQIARGVAPSTISANVTDVLATFLPHLDLAQPCLRQSQIMRGEVTLASEGMQAWKLAACKRVLSFGWDESTKFGNAVFSCNFQIENFDGTIEDICLRGLSILPEGGTSAAVLEHIQKRILNYSRFVLMRWKEEYEKVNGGEGSRASSGG